ncbi:hypothetical protein HYW32_01705 [Candidatus Berkelbacteria bacterium]|nr:hypothetical protein [Candidatus Berkelbacteria bacterium]
MQSTENTILTPVILRVMRHPLSEDRRAALAVVFGDDLEVVTEDVPYGADPVAAVQAVIDMIEATEEREVVAVEAGGPEPVMIALVEGLAEQGIHVLRQVFKRGEDGRVIVTGQDERGRDILAFGGYEVVGVEVRKALVQRPLEAPV